MSFCPKCGNQVEGRFCANCGTQQNQQQAAPANNSINIKTKKLNLDSIISIAFAAITLIFTFFSWFNIGEGYFNYSFGPYKGEIGELSGLLGLTKVLLIIGILVCIVYIATKLVDLGSLVPALASVDVAKFSGLAYYGLLALAFLFSLIAGIANVEEYGIEVDIGLNFSWYLALIVTAVAIFNMLRPQILKGVISNLTKKN